MISFGTLLRKENLAGLKNLKKRTGASIAYSVNKAIENYLKLKSAKDEKSKN